MVEDGDTTTATLKVHIKNNGYIFSLNDANLKITAFDTQYPEKPLGTGTEIFTVDTGEEFSGEVKIPMKTTLGEIIMSGLPKDAGDKAVGAIRSRL